jgi:hypothetical protein
LTHEPEEINYDTPLHENKDHQGNPYCYASVTEPQDEPTALEESSQDPAGPDCSELKGRQTPKRRPENAQPRVASELRHHVVVEESMGEESLHSAEDPEAMVSVQEESPSGDERFLRASSLGRSSGHGSQDSHSAEASDAMVNVQDEAFSGVEKPSRSSSRGRSSRRDSRETHSAEGSDAMINVRREVPLKDEILSRPTISLGRSSRRLS